MNNIYSELVKALFRGDIDVTRVSEAVQEMFNDDDENVKKSKDSEDFDLDFKLRSVDILPLEVYITEPCIEQVPATVEDHVLIENEIGVTNGGQIK